MFNKKNDTLVDSVKLVMEQNQLHRRVEAMVNEHFGITSKNALPHERHAEYDAILAEAKKCAMEELKDNQHKIDMNKNNRIDAHDFKLLRAKKKMSMEEDSEQLDEKAKSEQQQKFFGLVRAIQKGKAHGSAKAEKAAKEMSVKSVRDYAKTKHEGLPKKVDEQAVFEEIRSNLEEQLAYVYENYDEDTFNDYVNSLTEEQLEILGLDENAKSKIAGAVLKAASDPVGTAKSIYQGAKRIIGGGGGAAKNDRLIKDYSARNAARQKDISTVTDLKPETAVKKQASIGGPKGGDDGMKALPAPTKSGLPAARGQGSEVSTSVKQQPKQQTKGPIDGGKLKATDVPPKAPAAKTPKFDIGKKTAGGAVLGTLGVAGLMSGSSRDNAGAGAGGQRRPSGSARAGAKASSSGGQRRPSGSARAGAKASSSGGQRRPSGAPKPTFRTTNTSEIGTHMRGSLGGYVPESYQGMNEAFEELVYVYENYDEATFQEYIDSLTEEQLEMLGLDEAQSWSDTAGDALSKVKAFAQHHILRDTKAANKTLDDRFTNKEIRGMNGRYKETAGKSPTSPSVTAKKPAAPVNKMPAKTSAAPKRVPGAAAAAAQKRIGYDTKSAKTTPGEMMSQALREDFGTPVQVKESFEQFLRNKFLKG